MRLILPLSLICTLGLVTASMAQDKAPEPGAKIFQESCMGCHKGKTSLDNKRQTRAKWKEAVDRMIDTGLLDPPLPKAKIEILLDYLAKTKGPVESTGAEKK